MFHPCGRFVSKKECCKGWYTCPCNKKHTATKNTLSAQRKEAPCMQHAGGTNQLARILTAQNNSLSCIKPPSKEGGFQAPPKAADCPRMYPGTDTGNSRAQARQQHCPMPAGLAARQELARGADYERYRMTTIIQQILCKLDCKSKCRWIQ